MNVLKIPNPILSQKAVEVNDFDGAKSLINGMLETAYNEKLLGLAAVQVGFLQRAFVVNIGTVENPFYKEFVNPKIKQDLKAGKSWSWEGCASIENIQCLVERPNKIFISAQDINGRNFELTLFGLLARVCCHEQNHNDGILMTQKARQRRFIK